MYIFDCLPTLKKQRCVSGKRGGLLKTMFLLPEARCVGWVIRGGVGLLVPVSMWRVLCPAVTLGADLWSWAWPRSPMWTSHRGRWCPTPRRRRPPWWRSKRKVRSLTLPVTQQNWHEEQWKCVLMLLFLIGNFQQKKGQVSKLQGQIMHKYRYNINWS